MRQPTRLIVPPLKTTAQGMSGNCFFLAMAFPYCNSSNGTI